MYDYGARMYMPDIGVWGVVEPRPENYYFSSARNYADLESALNVEVVFMGWEN
ncbi:hypothetical protein [Halpernia sp. GG3]